MIALELAVVVAVTAGLVFFWQTQNKKQPEKEPGTEADMEAEKETGKETETETKTEEVVYQVGDIVPAEQVKEKGASDFFVVESIDEDVRNRMEGKSYVENPNISLDDLRYVRILHYNFDHEIQIGELVVNAAIADDCRNIFLELFENEYELQSVRLIDEYFPADGDTRAGRAQTADYNSIYNNNTSAFNYREIAGTSRISFHAYGRAIDINPLQNPSLAKNADGTFKYPGAAEHADRTSGKAHMITRDDVCYQVFRKYGFRWGGEWNGVLDYQHFEKAQ